MSILIEEPPEFNPVELIRAAQREAPALKYHHFAIVFKTSPTTIARWMCGANKPSKEHCIWAAELKRRWEL